MLRLSLLVAVVAGSVGCSAEPNTDFVGMPGLRVEVSVNRRIDREDGDAKSPSTVEVGLYYDHAVFAGGDDTHCATIDASGTFNGIDLDFTQAGEYDSELDCVDPTFQLEMPLGAMDAGHLDLHDHHGNQITAEFAPGTTAARIATLQSPATWAFAAGDHVELAWSHPEDFAGVSAADISVDFGVNGGSAFSIPVDSVDAAHVFLTMPTSPPVVGTGQLDIIVGQFGGAYAIGDATSCTGATRCTYSTVKGYEHAASVH